MMKYSPAEVGDDSHLVLHAVWYGRGQESAGIEQGPPGSRGAFIHSATSGGHCGLGWGHRGVTPAKPRVPSAPDLPPRWATKMSFRFVSR